MGDLELWSGAECTVNRVGDQYFDQIERTGHQTRQGDIDRIADLGVRAHRFPVLWERVAPRSLEDCDFSWSDARIAKLRERGVEPIIGLVHHGSGPRYATLETSAFASGLEHFARKVAERYPFVRYWTPVNEPLTTARFCGLYGHWYPHGQDLRTFFRVLRSEIEATAAAMRAIQSVIPEACLVQTEDHGRVSSTPLLRYQADYENQRRWLSLDLLTGRVDRDHPLRAELERHGYPAAALDALLEHPTPPGVVGINYYVTSDRFLDHRIDRYPKLQHGGNGRHRYVDTEAVRIREAIVSGHRAMIEEAFERYRIPVAITEAHLGCSREEQTRWLKRAWDAALAAKANGVDVRAVTVWSLFGAVDWSSLLTESRDDYEPGVFDVRGPQPRPTALAKLAAALGSGIAQPSSIIDSPGWWECERRLLESRRATPSALVEHAPLLVVGKGSWASHIAESCEVRGIACARYSLYEGHIENLLARRRPWMIVLAAPAEASGEQRFVEECRRWSLAAAAANTPISYLSTDLVFDGTQALVYREGDTTSPACAVGRASAAVESTLLEECRRALVVRLGPSFDFGHPEDPLTIAMKAVRRGQALRVVDNDIVSPVFVRCAVNTLLDLLIDGEEGIVHLASSESYSWRNIVLETARHLDDGLRPMFHSRGHFFGRGTPTGRRILSSDRLGALPGFLDELRKQALDLRLEHSGAA